ncbi:sensor histidine kinase [Algibacter sp. PT7-4]|uniref:sensor histidine kinase n=1 Tax=Algibacter ulvanivorans TaxID=3400999 RepID=UPI003AADA46E
MRIASCNFIFFLFVISPFCFSQNHKISDSFYNSIFSGNWSKSHRLLENYKNEIHDVNGKAKYNYYKGYLLLQKGDYLESYKSLLKSRTYCVENNLLKDQAKAESRLIECIYLLDNRNLSSEVINIISIEELIISTCNIAEKLDDDDIRIHCEYNSSTRAENLKNFNLSLKHAKNIGEIYLKQNDTARYIANLLNVAPTLNKLKQYEEAIKTLNIAEYYYDKNESKNYRNRILVYSHKSDQYYFLNKLDSALININKAKKLLNNYNNIDYKVFVYEQLSDIYEKKDNYKEAFLASKKLEEFRDSIQYQNLIKDIGDIKTKYESAEKEKENLLLKSKHQKSKYQIYALVGLIVFSCFIGFILFSNSKKNQLLIIKEKELEKEQYDRLLKDLELKSIDAMISGQEKERKKIAEDLHDNLGSSLTTVKLYFETLKDHVKTKELKIIKKTDLLLNEIYEKIRFMSHSRQNANLLTKGLIPAVKDLANKISESNKIEVIVAHHVENKTLENSLELNLFRILQELLTNAIKHSKAKNITINITSFENSINLLVEDNGIGFEIKKATSKNGIGFNNIKKRVKNYGGKIKIESLINHGSSISIDIPI